MKRGRKSAADLAVAPVVTVIPRPTAPDHLTEDEAAVWERIVTCMAPDYFRGHHLDQLANLCRHVVAARRLSAWVEKILSGEISGEIAEVERLLRMRARETGAANALARSLRLTKQAVVSPKGAAGQTAPDASKLWEFK